MKRPESLLVREHIDWLIETATEQTRGNITEAAVLLGVDRTTLSRWVNSGLTEKYYRKPTLDEPSACSGPLPEPVSP